MDSNLGGLYLYTASNRDDCHLQLASPVAACSQLSC